MIGFGLQKCDRILKKRITKYDGITKRNELQSDTVQPGNACAWVKTNFNFTVFKSQKWSFHVGIFLQNLS